MANPVGRGIRVVAGIALIVVGVIIGSIGGYVLVAVGAVAFLAGAMNFCLIAPLINSPFSGKAALTNQR